MDLYMRSDFVSVQSTRLRIDTESLGLARRASSGSGWPLDILVARRSTDASWEG